MAAPRGGQGAYGVIISSSGLAVGQAAAAQQRRPSFTPGTLPQLVDGLLERPALQCRP